MTKDDAHARLLVYAWFSLVGEGSGTRNLVAPGLRHTLFDLAWRGLFR